MARIIGNTAPGMEPTGTGSGVGKFRAPFGRITIVSDADGDVFRLPIAWLFGKAGQVYQGVFAQSMGPTGGTVQVDTTLAEPDLAMNPKMDTPASGQQSLWHVDTTCAVGTTISKLSIPCPTALRITFAKKGTILYLAGV